MTEAEQDELLRGCTEEICQAVWMMIRRRIDWARLPVTEREALRPEMDRVDRAVLNAAVEQVIGSIALTVRIKVVATKETKP